MQKIYLYRMTHILNIPHILQKGITHRLSPDRNRGYIEIGDSSLIATRQATVLSNGRRLSDFTPFYFGPKMPMLYVIQNGFNGVEKRATREIIYCVSSVQKISDLNLTFFFTDGHAASMYSSVYDKHQLEAIETLVDFQAVKTTFWHSEDDTDLKRRKEAEFLVLGDIPIQAILGYIAFDEIAKNNLLEFGISSEKIVIRPEAYF